MGRLRRAVEDVHIRVPRVERGGEFQKIVREQMRLIVGRSVLDRFGKAVQEAREIVRLDRRVDGGRNILLLCLLDYLLRPRVRILQLRL